MPPSVRHARPETTLEAIVTALGTGVAELIVAPAGRGVGVSAVVIDEPLSPPAVEGAIVLAVGASIDGPTIGEVLRRHGSCGAAATVLAGDGDLPLGIRRDLGHAVLRVAPGLSWGHLHSLLDHLITGTRAGIEEPDVVVNDLFSLANAIAAAVGGATAIEDHRRRVIAFSNLPDQPIDEARRTGILGRQVPMLPTDDHWYRELFRATGWMRVPAEGDTWARVAIGVRAGTEPLGSIWVVDDGLTVPDGVLEDAAALAALQLLRLRLNDDVARRSRQDQLQRLLVDASRDDGLALRGVVGDDVICWCVRAPVSSPLDRTALGEQIATASVDWLRLNGQPAVGCRIGGRVAVLVRASSAGRGRDVATATEMLRHLRAVTKAPLDLAMGSRTTSIHEAERSWREADAVMDELDRTGTSTTGPVPIEAVAADVTLTGIAAALASRPWLHTDIAGLESTDDPTLEPTLRAVLDAGGDRRRAAEMLGVHVNTVRYRLRQIETKVGVDLDDPVNRLVVWLQLHLRDRR